MPQLTTIIALLGLLGVAEFDRYTLNPATGAATVAWRFPLAPAAPGAAANLPSLLVGLLTAIRPGTTVTALSVGANGVPSVTVTIPPG